MTMTLEEAIWREMSLAYSYKERMRMMQITGEALGDLPKLEAEHKQMAEWLKELKEIRRKPEPRLVNYESDGDADGFPVCDYARCPNCDHWFEDSDDSWEANYCPYCGQALEWEVNADDNR